MKTLKHKKNPIFIDNETNKISLKDLLRTLRIETRELIYNMFDEYQFRENIIEHIPTIPKYLNPSELIYIIKKYGYWLLSERFKYRESLNEIVYFIEDLKKLPKNLKILV